VTRLNWKAAISAGLIAGLIFMVLEMILVGTIGGGSPWGPPRMIAAIAMGSEVLPPPASFDLGMFVVAMMVHFALSILLGIVFAAIAEAARWRTAAASAFGLVFGLLIYLVHFYGMTALFPWFAMARGAISIFAHAAFGLVLGYAYRRLAPCPGVTATGM
jgi:hypothetical protein